MSFAAQRFGSVMGLFSSLLEVGSMLNTSLRKFALGLVCILDNNLFLPFKGFFSDIMCFTEA